MKLKEPTKLNYVNCETDFLVPLPKELLDYVASKVVSHLDKDLDGKTYVNTRHDIFDIEEIKVFVKQLLPKLQQHPECEMIVAEMLTKAADMWVEPKRYFNPLFSHYLDYAAINDDLVLPHYMLLATTSPVFFLTANFANKFVEPFHPAELVIEILESEINAEGITSSQIFAALATMESLGVLAISNDGLYISTPVRANSEEIELALSVLETLLTSEDSLSLLRPFIKGAKNDRA